jgi:chromosome segregation ATPase
MDCSTIVATASFVLTFLSGSTMLSLALALTAIASGVGSFYMRRLELMKDLEATAEGLKKAKDQFEGMAKGLQVENRRLTETNLSLENNNQRFHESNQALTQTNTQLNNEVASFRQQVAQLTLQCTQLTLQCTQLRESAEKIRLEMNQFQKQNAAFKINIGNLDEQIASSKALCDQIAHHLSSQEKSLGQQLQQLSSYLAELRDNHSVSHKMQELATLQAQVMQAVNQLHTIQLKYTQEHAQFQTIREALVKLRTQFDAAIRDASQGMQNNNQQLQRNITELKNERERISAVLNRHFSQTL